MTIEIPDELEPHLIGVWKFRQAARRPTWCTTFMVDGAFYDTPGARTPEKAIERALRDLRRVKK
jgi:hypothetical protein